MTTRSQTRSQTEEELAQLNEGVGALDNILLAEIQELKHSFQILYEENQKQKLMIESKENEISQLTVNK